MTQARHDLGDGAPGLWFRQGEQRYVVRDRALLQQLQAAYADAGRVGRQQAALGKYLAFNRSQEASADAAGAKYLSAAGLSGLGSVAFFKRLQNLEMRHGWTRTYDSEFYRTHPLTADRIATLQDTYEKDPAWNAPAVASGWSQYPAHT